MIYCVYCGKGFSRKEHLERHLPSHTNVKPYHCGDCHLGFSRRDLLQRHHLTYHVAKDPMSCPPGSMATPEKKSRIACASCALAKTGCDKQTPSCTRCRDKGITCVPRHARRTARLAAIRKQRAPPMPSQASPVQLAPQSQPTSPSQPASVMAFDTMIGVDRGDTHCSPQMCGITSPSQQLMTIGAPISQSGNCQPVANSHTNPDFFSSSHGGAENPNSIFQFSHENFPPQESVYLWPPSTCYEIDFDIFPSNLSGARASPSTPALTHTRNTSNSDLSSSDWSSCSASDHITSSPAQHDPEFATVHAGPNGEPAFTITEDSVGAAGQLGWSHILYSNSRPRTDIIRLDGLDENSSTLEALQQYMQQTEPGWDNDTGLPSI